MKARLVVGAVCFAVCLGAWLLARHGAIRGAKHRAELEALRGQVAALETRLKAAESRLAQQDERTNVVVRLLGRQPEAPPAHPAKESAVPFTSFNSRTRPPNAIEEFDINGQKFYLTPLANGR